MKKNLLIIRFDSNDVDYDKMISIETSLIKGFKQQKCAKWDGHDTGSGECNIFFYVTDSWDRAIDIVKAYLKTHEVLDKAIIAKRFKISGKYEVVHPEGYSGEFSPI